MYDVFSRCNGRTIVASTLFIQSMTETIAYYKRVLWMQRKYCVSSEVVQV